MKLDVFGRKMEVLREKDQWLVFVLGEGKKRRIDVAIPSDIKEQDIPRFLSDLFHEAATAERPEVVVID